MKVLKAEFLKAGITDETLIQNYNVRMRTIVRNFPPSESDPQGYFTIENKYVIQEKNTFGKELLETAFDMFSTASVVPSSKSPGFLVSRGGGQIIFGEIRKSMGILYNVNRFSTIGKTRVALTGTHKLEDIMEAGKAFVGKNAKVIKTLKGKVEAFESTDGLRRFRLPTKKSFAGGSIQANFEQRINKDIKWGQKTTETQRSNMHVNSDKEYKP